MLFHLSAFHSIWDGVERELGRFAWIDDVDFEWFWCIDWRQHVNESGWLWMNTRHYHATYREFFMGGCTNQSYQLMRLVYDSSSMRKSHQKQLTFFRQKISRKTSWNPLLTISSWSVGKLIHFCTCLLDIEISPRIYVPFSKMAMEHLPF